MLEVGIGGVGSGATLAKGCHVIVAGKAYPCDLGLMWWIGTPKCISTAKNARKEEQGLPAHTCAPRSS